MKYTRKGNQTNKALYLIAITVGIGLIYLGFFEMHLIWNVLTIPISLILIIIGYKNYKRANYIIQSIKFEEDKLRILFLNGTSKEILNKNLRYALLAKKYYKPIRSIEFIEKKKVALFRGKSIGRIDFAKWEKDIEPIARYMISNIFERKKWKFGWSLGDFLMIFAILLGMTEGIAENYIEAIDLNLSSTVGELGEIISEENEKSKGESIIAQNKYLKNNV